MRQTHPRLLGKMIGDLQMLGATVTQDEKSDRIFINETYSASLFLARCTPNRSGTLRWRFRARPEMRPDIWILARMDPANKAPADYYLLPLVAWNESELRLRECNGSGLDTFRFDTLDFFLEMGQFVEVEVAA